MDIYSILSNQQSMVIIVSLLIFISRIIDVSLGTIRVIYIARGRKFIAPILGFFEVLIWLLVVQQLFTNIDNVYYYLAYGAGFAAGTFSGMVIEEKFNKGKVLTRIITKKKVKPLIEELNSLRFSVTQSTATRNNLKTGKIQKVNILYMITRRKRIPEVIKILREFDSTSQYSIEDVRIATEIHPEIKGKNRRQMIRWGFFRKSK